MRRKRCKDCGTLVNPTEACWKCKYTALDNITIGKIKDAAREGKHYVYAERMLPAGRKAVSAYHGASGGVWTIDHTGAHWAGVSLDEANRIIR